MKETSGAVYDYDDKYRYRLWRRWNAALPSACMILHNPPSIDVSNDPTITRCAALAEKWGYGGIEIVNLFAYRATKPHELWQAEDPIGPHNDEHIKRALIHSKICVVAWGDIPAGRRERSAMVLRLVENKPLYCLGITKLRQPRHPLYPLRFSAETPEVPLEPFHPTIKR